MRSLPTVLSILENLRKTYEVPPPIQSTGNVWKTKIAAQETIRKVYIEKD